MIGDFQSDWHKYNPIKKLKGQRGSLKAPLSARGFSCGFAACGFGPRPTRKIPTAHKKNHRILCPLSPLCALVNPCDPCVDLASPCVHYVPWIPWFPRVTEENALCYPILRLLPCVNPCYPQSIELPLLPCITLVTLCYPLLPLLPFVPPCYTMLPCVTPCYPCYPVLPLVTLVTLSYLRYPALPLLPHVTLVTLCHPVLPLLRCSTPC